VPRYSSYSHGDDAPQVDGDAGFIGVDARRDPRQLEPGLCAMAVNKQFRQGIAETRPGFCSVGWGTEWATTLPTDFLLQAALSSADNGTGDSDNLGVSAHKVTDRGINEFEFRGVTRVAGDVGWSVGDIIVTSSFMWAAYNGTWVITYAGDGRMRVTPDAAVFAAAPPSDTGGGIAAWEGTINFDIAQGFGTIYGAGIFSDPNAQEGTLIALENYAKLLRDGQPPQVVYYPDGVTVTDAVRFVQCFDRVLMLRGLDLAPLEWNPQQDFESGLGQFEEITEDGSGTGSFIEPIPNSISGVEYNGRLYLQYGRDQIAVSDVYDYTHYDPLFSAFRINEGSDDSMQALLPFGEQRMLVFFDQSIWLLSGLYGDLTDAKGDLITKERGAVSRDAVVQMGPDVWFLSEGGVYSVAQTQDAQLQAAAEPISAPIQPLLDRVNWAVASAAQAVSHNGRFFLAVPLDDATYNNALLVYDQVSQQWWGYWQSAALDILSMLKTNHSGQRRVIMINGDNLATAKYHGAVIVMDEGFTDEVYGDHLQISDEVTTRGYSWQGIGRKRTTSMEVELSTWKPSFEITHIVNGVKEEKSLTGGAVTRDRAQYTVFAKTDYVTTNINDDHAEPYREDYSVQLTGALTGWCAALVSNDPNDLTIRLYLPVDYTDVTLSPATVYTNLHPVSAGDVVEVTGFLADGMNRTFIVAQDSSVATPEAVCTVTSAEKAAIIASCDTFYSVNGSGYYIMPEDPGSSDTYIRSWDVENAASTPLWCGSNGVVLSRHQYVERKLKLRLYGAWGQVKIQNTQGRCLLHALQMEANEAQRNYRERT